MPSFRLTAALTAAALFALALSANAYRTAPPASSAALPPPPAPAANGQRPRAPEYTMDFSLPAVHMSVADVVALLEKTKHFLSAAGSGQHNTDSLTLSDGVRRFTVTDDFSSSALKGAPTVSYHLSYHFLTGAGPVTGVSFDLDDFSREISVTGQNQEHVEALARFLQAEFDDHVTHFAGTTARFLVSISLVIVGLMVINLARSYWLMGAGALLSLGGLGAGLTRGTSWLPGTAIYKGSPDFLVRYERELLLLGLALEVAALGVHLFHSRNLHQRQPGESHALAPSAKPRRSKRRGVSERKR